VNTTGKHALLLTAKDFVQIARQRSEKPWRVGVTAGGTPYITDGAKQYPLPPKGKGLLTKRVVDSLVEFFGLEAFYLDFALDPREDH
jgi:hypothetical protein